MCGATYLAPLLNGVLGWQGLGTTGLRGYIIIFRIENSIMYTSVEIQNELLKIMSHSILRQFARHFHSVVYYLWFFRQDISCKDQAIFRIRCVYDKHEMI